MFFEYCLEVDAHTPEFRDFLRAGLRHSRRVDCEVMDWIQDNIKGRWNWMLAHPESDDPRRLVSADELLKRLFGVKFYFESRDDIILFKLTWGGHTYNVL